MKKLLLILFLTFSNSAFAGLFEKIYGVNFAEAIHDFLRHIGIEKCEDLRIKNKEEASDIYKKMVSEALRNMNYRGPEIKVKKKTADLETPFARGATNGKTIILEHENNPASELTTYHEVAHVVLQHPDKKVNRGRIVYGIFGIIFSLTHLILFKKLKKNYLSPSLAKLIGALFLLDTTNLTASQGYLVNQFFSREDEFEADKLAVKTLCEQGKLAVVEHEMDDLKKKAMNDAQRYIEKHKEQISEDDTLLFNENGLVFSINHPEKTIGDLKYYIKCYKCYLLNKKKICTCSHPSDGVRYFEWKKIIDNYKSNQKDTP